MVLPGRTYNAGSYRYGFNGKEKDRDMDGNNYDYGFRIYNQGLCRFLSVDPLTEEYPFYTPYQFAGNKPIIAIDIDGLEEQISIAPVKYRVNTSKTKLHGYYNKGYNMSVYSVSSPILAVGFRSDSDINEDWSHVKTGKGKTNKKGNKIEGKYGKIGWDPSKLNLLTIPGNNPGQNHFDGFQDAKVSMGDLYFAQVIGKDGSPGNSVVGVVGDVGPNTQPG